MIYLLKALLSGLLIVLVTHLSYWFAVGVLGVSTLAKLMIVTEVTLFTVVFLISLVISLDKIQ
jgi:hypothetical protein